MTEPTMHPRQLPELRAKLLSKLTAPKGRDLAIRLNESSSFGRRAATPRTTAEEVWQAEVDSLRSATLFHVSGEMSRLSMIAGHTLTEVHLRPWDLPAPCGFMWFDTPIPSEVGKRGGSIRAVTWALMPYGSAISQRIADSNRLIGDVWLDDAGRAWLVWMNFFAESPNAVTAESLGPIMAEWESGAILGDAATVQSASLEWRAVVAAWLLMAQQIADVVDLTLPPTVTRKHRRRGYSRQPVRVVTVKPAHAARAGDPAAREYRHRWIVRGHWRNQWFPKQKRHVPMWINPHVKGPEGAPILDRQETVHAWK